jgi:glucans biosynthesis protein
MRLHLTLGLITILALALTLRAERKEHHFAFAQVDQLAQKRAAAKYVPSPEVLPPQLKKLTPDQDAGIFWKDTYRLWRNKGLPFQVDFYHQLNSNPLPHIAPAINTVDTKGAHPLAYSPLFFNFLNLQVKPATPMTFEPPLPNNLGYAGFYVRYPDMAIGSNANSLDGFFSALGCSYFRALAKQQVYGLSARGLAIDTGIDNKPEEFPIFTDWWLQEPATTTSTALVLDALLDSPSVAGAYEFTIHPGGVTSVDIHASLYFRAKVDRLGIAPFSSMYLFGENAKNHFGDNVHPEIHDSDGVLLHTGTDEWIWRPLGQDTQLQLYNFIDENPKGFGLLQRDRDFQHYQDLQMNYNVRPSAWVTPHGDWGKGAVQLIHRPSNNVNFDNVVLMWNPAQPINPGDHLDLNYTIDFYMNDAARPPLAYVKQTLINSPAPTPPAAAPPAVAPPTPPGKSAPAAKPVTPPPTNSGTLKPPAPPPPPAPVIPTGTVPVQFLVDFTGNGIENTPGDQPPELDLGTSPPGTYLRESHVEKNSFDNSWRVTFTIIPAKRYVPTELRCRLKQGGKVITETWSYTWNQ